MRLAALLVSIVLAASPTLAQVGAAKAAPSEAMSTAQAQIVAIDLFESICVHTEDHSSAKNQARSLGFFYAPPVLSGLLSEMRIEDGSVLMKAFDGAFALAMTGVAPNGRPEFSDQVCAVGIAPSAETINAAVEKFLDVGPPQSQAGAPIIWYKNEGKKRVRLEQTGLRGADVRKGLRPRAVIVQSVATPFGPTALVTQLETRPR